MTPMTPASSGLTHRIWDGLTRPYARIPAARQRKARTLAGLVLLTLPLLLLDMALAYSTSLPWQYFLPVFALLCVAYGITRTPYYRAGGLMAALALLLTPPLLIVTGGGFINREMYYILTLIVAALLIIGYLYSARVALGGLVLVFIGALLITPFVQTNTVVYTTNLVSLAGMAFILMLMYFMVRRFDREDHDAMLKELRLTEQRYSTLLDSKSEVVTRWKADLTITYVNDAYCRYMGLPAGALIGKNLLDIIDPRERDFILKYNQEIHSGVGPYMHESPFYSRDGRTYWMQWYDYALYDTDGNVIEYQSFGRDITERKQAEDALRMSEQRYRAVVEMQREMIVRWTPDTTITFANDAYCQLHNTAHDDLIGQKVLDRIQEPEREQARKVVALMQAGETPGPYENRFIDGRGVERWMQWEDRPIYDETGAITEYQTVGRDLSTLHRTVTALRDSQTRLEALVNGLDAIIWEVDAATQHTYFISQSVERILGYTVTAIMGDPGLWQSAILEADRQKVFNSSGNSLHTNGNYAVEYRMQTADGRVIWLRDLATIIHQPGKPNIVRGVSIDISSIKATQEAEREQRAFAEALRDTIAATTSTLDLHEVLDRILDQIGKVLPHTARDILLIDGDRVKLSRAAGYESYEDFPSEDIFSVRTSDIPNFRLMAATGQPRLIRDIWNDPDWVKDVGGGLWKRSYVGAPIRLDGVVIGFINVNGMAVNDFDETDAAHLATFADQAANAIRNARLYAALRDDADRLDGLVRERTAELQLERQRLQAVLEASGEGIVYTEDAVIQYVNRALCDMIGYTPDDLIGLNLATAAHPVLPADYFLPILEAINKALWKGEVWRSEGRLIRRDGQTVHVGMTVSAVAMLPDSHFRTVSIVRDISREKQLQVQRSAFVAHASHELRTPLTNMKTRLYLLGKTPDRLVEHIAVLEQVTDWMHKLIEDLLDMTRYERGMIPMHKAPVDLRVLLRDAAETQRQEAERRHMAYVLELPTQPIPVHADARRLLQVFTNLITNAINYTPEGGAIRLEAALTTEENGTPQAVVHIIDSGVGIKPEHLHQIFQPFFRVVSHVEGTGLGLSISREIVEQHEGRIDVTSAAGEGSTFSVVLPLAMHPAVTPS